METACNKHRIELLGEIWSERKNEIRNWAKGIRVRLGRVDSRVTHQHPFSTQRWGSMARYHDGLQVMVQRLQGTLFSLRFRPRCPIRLAPRVNSLVDPSLRDQDRFHASICRPMGPILSHPDTHSSLFRSISRPRRPKVPTFSQIPMPICLNVWMKTDECFLCKSDLG